MAEQLISRNPPHTRAGITACDELPNHRLGFADLPRRQTRPVHEFSDLGRTHPQPSHRLLVLENKLAWTPGSIDNILAGGEPKETVVELRRPTSAPAHAAGDALSRAATEELLLELRLRITAPRDRRHETWDDWDDSLDPRGDWPEHGLAAPKNSGSDMRDARRQPQLGPTAPPHTSW